MGIGVSNKVTATLLSGSSTTLAYSGAVTAGSTLVAGGGGYNTAGTPAAPAVSDSVNGSWTISKYGGLTADTNIEIWLATFVNTAGGTPTVTWNPNGSSEDMGGWFICEVTSGGAVDVTPAVSQQSGTVTPSIASGTLAQANEALFAIMSPQSPISSIAKDSTYTDLVNQPDNASSQALDAQYKIVATTASDTADWTITGTGGSCVSILISVKEASASAPFVPHQTYMVNIVTQ